MRNHRDFDRTFNRMATITGCVGAIVCLSISALLFAAAVALLTWAGVL